MKRRDLVVKAPFAVAALAGTSRDWLLASLENDKRGPRRAGMAQVEAIRETFRIFQEADVLKGGGQPTRVALAQYLTGVVIPMLHDRHSEDVQHALYEAASEQTYLAGWMAFDDGQHGLAQRYLTQSLRLAQASGNTVLGSHVLAGMSDQATQLGHPSEGLQLARAGQQALRGWHAPAALTDLYTLEARALAAMGRARDTATAIDQAEHTFDQINRANEPEWARFIDTAYVSGEIANCFRDLERHDEAERFARESIHASELQNRARRGALSQAVLAVSQVQANDVDAALATATRALELSRQVYSERCVTALADFSQRLTPHRNEPGVRDFLERLRTPEPGNGT